MLIVILKLSVRKIQKKPAFYNCLIFRRLKNGLFSTKNFTIEKLLE